MHAVKSPLSIFPEKSCKLFGNQQSLTRIFPLVLPPSLPRKFSVISPKERLKKNFFLFRINDTIPIKVKITIERGKYLRGMIYTVFLCTCVCARARAHTNTQHTHPKCQKRCITNRWTCKFAEKKKDLKIYVFSKCILKPGKRILNLLRSCTWACTVSKTGNHPFWIIS